jgi:hypothetical protein
MNLTELALKHGSDKAGHHNYTPIYEKYFAPFRDQPITLLELGIGGYEFPDRGGASLKMWYEYFPKADIVGIDLHSKTGLSNERTWVYKASQTDHIFLEGLLKAHGNPNIIIDDASHINKLTIQSFVILFPLLAPGGIYVVEDIESSWAPLHSWAMGCDNYKDLNEYCTVNFFRRLVDEMNGQYIPHYETWGFPEIDSIHFYKNIIFIQKK